MKLTVKKYKHLNVGHEGGVWKCELYINGVLAAHVDNDGSGGQNNYRWVGYANQWTTPDDVEAFVKAQPEQDMCGVVCQPDLDVLVGDAIRLLQIDKIIAAKCKKAVVWSLPTDPEGTIREYRVPYSLQSAEAVRAQFPGAFIYNEAM